MVSAIFSKIAQATSASSLLVDMVPSNPAPAEDVTITLNSYASNLDSVLITWYIDGKNSASGIGKKTFSLQAGAAGTEHIVKVVVSLPDGDISNSMTVRPSVMVLLWQANDSYVPPFYEGKAMPSAESDVKVVAIPEIKSGSSIVNPQNMTYVWQKDYNNDVNDSGYGKNFMIYTNDYLDNSNNISVTASTVDQKYSSNASVDIAVATPKILFYKNDANVGTTWENDIPDTQQIQNSETIQAVPYFLSPKQIQNPMLVWNWSINDSAVSVPNYMPNFMPLQVETGVSGTSTVKLEISNQSKIFETASKEININF
jgi:hypothetical protein